MKNIYVQPHAKTKVYRVMFNHHGKRINVGNFDTIEEAEKALRAAQRECGIKVITVMSRNRLRAYLTICLGHLNTVGEMSDELLDKDLKEIETAKNAITKILKRYA